MPRTSASHGTTRSISSRNSRLRVFFVDRFSPSPGCFMSIIVTATEPSRYRICPRFCRISLRARVLKLPFLYLAGWFVGYEGDYFALFAASDWRL